MINISEILAEKDDIIQVCEDRDKVDICLYNVNHATLEQHLVPRMTLKLDRKQAKELHQKLGSILEE